MTAYRRVPFQTIMFSVLVAVLLVAGCQTRHPVDQGALYYQRGQIQRADAKLSKAVEQDQTDWRGKYYLGLVRLKQNQPREAELLLDQALSLHSDQPQTPMILDALAEALFQQGEARTSNLYALLKQATDYYGTSYDFTRQGRFMAKSDDFDGALVAFRKAIRFADADDPAPHIAMADFYEQVGDIPNAIEALRHAYTITPNDPVLAERFRGHGVVPGPSLTVDSSKQ